MSNQQVQNIFTNRKTVNFQEVQIAKVKPNEDTWLWLLENISKEQKEQSQL